MPGPIGSDGVDRPVDVRIEVGHVEQDPRIRRRADIRLDGKNSAISKDASAKSEARSGCQKSWSPRRPDCSVIVPCRIRSVQPPEIESPPPSPLPPPPGTPDPNGPWPRRRGRRGAARCDIPPRVRVVRVESDELGRVGIRAAQSYSTAVCLPAHAPISGRTHAASRPAGSARAASGAIPREAGSADGDTQAGSQAGSPVQRRNVRDEREASADCSSSVAHQEGHLRVGGPGPAGPPGGDIRGERIAGLL